MRLRSCSLAVLVVAACSSGSTGPHATPDIFFVAGNHQSDTILGKLPQALLIAVRIPRGQSTTGHLVRFTSPPDTNARLGNQVYFNPPYATGIPFNASEWDDTTNTAAQASVNITMGAQAGLATVVITVPDFGYVDTATFTVLPGGAFNVVASPSDMTMFTGASFTYNSHTVDRYGNPRNDSIVYTVEQGPLTMSGAKATAGAPGSAIVSMIAPKPGVGTSGTVTVVPHGVLAASNGTGIVTFQLDGSGMQTILQGTTAGHIKWDPTGTHLAFDGYGCGAGSPILSTTDLHGDTTVIGNGGNFQGTGNYYDSYPSYSPDGKWVYYQQSPQAGSGTGHVRRVHVDGTGDTLVVAPFAYYPSPAPDNNRIAYVDASNITTTDLRILNLSTGMRDSIQASVWSPEWSPAGNQIAYLTPFDGCTGQIALIAPDGSNNHALTSDTYHEGFDWSPDAQWIVATNVTTGLMDLISSTTGQAIPLPYTRGLSSPAWQPGSSSSNRIRNKLGHK